MDLLSQDGKFNLNLSLEVPENARGILLCLHDMADHQGRYAGLLNFAKKNGLIGCSYDQRGHGMNLTIDSLGYFNDVSGKQIVNDVDVVVEYLSEKYNLPIYLFGQGMGALVAKNYLQKNDTKIAKVVLAGSPSYNRMLKFNLNLARTLANVDYRGRAKILNDRFFGNYYKAFGTKDNYEYISKNTQNRIDYQNDPFCGFEYTNNGYLNLAKIHLRAYKKSLYLKNNQNLKILFIAGSKDPVIDGIKAFNDQLDFLEALGYEVTSKLYGDCRHEILNENIKQAVYQDIVDFLVNA